MQSNMQSKIFDPVNFSEKREPISMDSSTSEHEGRGKRFTLSRVPLLISVSFVVQIGKPLRKRKYINY